MHPQQALVRRTGIPSVLLAVALALPSTGAQAQDRFYLGMDAMNWFLDEDGGSDFSALGVRGRVGIKISEQFAVEAHLGGTGTDRSGGERRELDFLYAGLVRGDLPITRYTSLYGVMGVAGVELGGRDTDDASVSRRDSGVSLGIGADFSIADGAHVNIDYIRYVNASDLDFSAISVGARWSF
ncbi:porin family protein [Aquisalimonas sp.]|uniref:porin family protein n=1 Tax=Aquisalimonas sp. TaxID=1872621 RepID=UPI0025BF037D|nr:porin family protein [Aquisalimonas sp.]